MHLKSGGTIVADSIEDRGDEIVVHQGRGRIVVPRGDVASIEKSPPKTKEPAPPGGGTAPAPIPGDAADQQRLEDLRRRTLSPGPAREENRRQLVVLLDQMAERALRERRPEEARRLFQEALTWDPAHLRGSRGLAASYLAQDNLPLARSLLERALLEHPDDPDLLVLLGETAARQDRAAEAIAAWEKALANRDSPSLRERIETLKRLSSVDAGYERREAAHFTVAYDGDRTVPDLEPAIIAYLDERYTDLASRFDYLPPHPLAVVIYPEKDFYAATRADPDVAGLYDGTVRVPCGGLSRLDAAARAVLVHELAHAFIAGKSRDGAPRWLQEGLAQLMEGRQTDQGTARTLARQYRESGGGASWGATFTYASSLSFVEFLVARYGFDALNRTLQGLGGGHDADAALHDATGFPLDELRRQWGDDLVARLQ